MNIFPPSLFVILVFGGITLTETVSAIAYFPSPLKQISDGVDSTKVICTEGLELVIKFSNGLSACVKPSSVAKLIEGEWAIHVLPDIDLDLIQNSELTQNGKYDVTTSLVNYDGSTGFQARPDSTESFPGIIMIHEWWGLNENMKETATKLASHGYVVLAVDLFQGDVATDAQKATQMISSFEQEQGIINTNDAVNYLQTNHDISKIGSIGWCFGGGQSLNLAPNNEEMDASLIYYGRLVTEPESTFKNTMANFRNFCRT
jgi:carboxymethylenebutenolidase